MANVSSSNSQKDYPQLRLKAADGGAFPAWKCVTMGQLYQERKTPGNETLPILSVSIHTGVSDGSLDEDELGKRVKRSEDKSLYKQALTGDLVFNMMRAWQGAIGVVKTSGMVSPAYIVAEPNEGVYPPFMDFLFSTPQMINCIHRLSYGVTDFRLRLYWDSFVSIDCRIPQVDEQMKIAQFLSKIDQKIDAQQRLINALKSYKRGFEEALFDHFLSDEENTVIPLGELGFFYGGLSGKSKEDFGVGSALYIPYMNVYKNTFADTDACENVKIRAGEKQNTIRFGDLLFTQSSETTEEVGLTSVWLSTTQPYLNSFCFGFRPNSGYPIDPYYSGYLMRSHRVRTAIMREGQGATRVNLSPERLKDIHISLPHYPQQKYLGALLFKFDQRIKNEELVLEAIKLQRKGLVSKLFV